MTSFKKVGFKTEDIKKQKIRFLVYLIKLVFNSGIWYMYTVLYIQIMQTRKGKLFLILKAWLSGINTSNN